LVCHPLGKYSSWLLKTSSPSAFMMTFLRDYGPESIYCFQVSGMSSLSFFALYLFLIKTFGCLILTQGVGIGKQSQLSGQQSGYLNNSQNISF